MTARQARIAELLAELLAEVPAPRPPRKSPRSKPAKAKNTFYASVIAARVPCAYGVAKCGRFAPNGVGSKQHTTCPKGLAAMRKAAK